MNVRTSAVPSGRLTFGIANGHSPSPEPAIGSIGSTHAVFRLVVITGPNAEVPLRDASLPVVRVNVIQPAKTTGRAHGSPCVFIESVADIIPGSILPPIEDNVRRGP